MSNLFEQHGTMIFLLLIIGTTVFFLLRNSRYYARQRREEADWKGTQRASERTPPAGHSTPMGELSSEMTHWEVEMHDTARELKAQLDSKMRALQALIAEADRAAARLEAARQNRGAVSANDGAHSAPYENGEGAHSAPYESTVQPTNQAEALRPGPASAISQPAPQHRQEEIYTLSDYGFSPHEIAQRLGAPIGEVELILNLRGKR
jgi:hypothetical protein